MRKVCLMTCSALTDVVGSVARRAVYLVVEELRPECTVLGCLPATNAGVKEDMDYIRDYPTIAVEGCNRRCVSVVMQKKGYRPVLIFDVGEYLARGGIQPEPGEIKELGSVGKEAARLVAQKVAGLVDTLVKEEQ